MAPHSSAVKHPSRAAPPPAMGTHRCSHAIAKGPPRKIRIVHVVEPTVIKTDARQFRELVQRLTGKPPSGVRGGGGGVEGASSSSSAESASADSSSREAAGGSSPGRAVVAPAAVKAEVKEEEEEEYIAPTEEEVFAHAFGEGLGDTMKDWGMTETAKAAVKEEVEGLAGAFGEMDDKYEYDAFFHGVDDFLLSTFQEDGFCL